MASMDNLNREIQKLIRAKGERRHKLMALPWSEKVRVIIQMQRMAAPLLKSRGSEVSVWQIEGMDDHAAG